MQLTTILVLLCLFVVSCAHHQTKIDSESISSEIKKKGAKVVTTSLYADSQKWDGVLSHIETGDVHWIEVAAQLYRGAEPAAAEGISFSLARALRENPTEVLKRIGSPFRLESVCQVPYSEPTRKMVDAFRREVLISFSMIKVPAIRAVATKCIARIK